MPPHACCEICGVGEPVDSAVVGAGPGFTRVSKKESSAASWLALWLVAPEMPTYEGTTHVGVVPPRRISVCGSGLDGHSIHAIFWLCAWNVMRPTAIVMSTRFGFVSCAA